MNIVIVESPAKAKTVNKYLGSGYRVLASYGHVRDLPSKNGSVLPDKDFEMHWDVEPKAAKRLDEIAKAVKGATKLILATDPDREGEAISWHVYQILNRKKALDKVAVERVVFNAVTKEAVLDAMRHPREIDGPLVNAYLARRALDYLVGFTLSPVLWRKLPGARSAGRVQSVALRLVCDRELEIEQFKAQEYWSLAAELATAKNETFLARLTAVDGKKLEKFDIADEVNAMRLKAALEGGRFVVQTVESKSQRRHPAPPFTTSTLQQEASRKLGFSPRHTMQIAQRLYEGVDMGGESEGLITYMRTDGVQIAPEAIAAARRTVEQLYGRNYVPASPRQYETKAKNAQEAHEAIRPTVPSPMSIPSYRRCATVIVRCAPKPSLREASCCSVEVVNGAAGLRRRCFLSTFATVSLPLAVSRIFCSAARTWVSFVNVNCSTLSPPNTDNRAGNCVEAASGCALSASASIVQYSCALNAVISSSRSTMSRNAGLCTRPADSPRRTFFQSSGDRLKPTR